MYQCPGSYTNNRTDKVTSITFDYIVYQFLPVILFVPSAYSSLKFREQCISHIDHNISAIVGLFALLIIILF